MFRIFRSPGPLVYGTITVGAVLDAESTNLETFSETIAGVAIAMVVYWLAYSYAQVTADRVQKGQQLTLRLVVDKMAHEVSILTGAAVRSWWSRSGMPPGQDWGTPSPRERGRRR